ncbi:MAG: SnoaL-like domain-containing protein [Phyllobacteriaceae bacterium]|nr:SnoaL-like domain-containing protein [Phyllobacteriaceae bacterium]
MTDTLIDTRTDTLVHRLFAAFGDSPEAVSALFAPDGEILAVRPDAEPGHPLYGTHRGPDGIRRVLAAFAATFEPEHFEIDDVVETPDRAWASGRFGYRVRATGHLFASDWALKLELRDGKIRRYRFFEDSEALALALRP